MPVYAPDCACVLVSIGMNYLYNGCAMDVCLDVSREDDLKERDSDCIGAKHVINWRK